MRRSILAWVCGLVAFAAPASARAQGDVTLFTPGNPIFAVGLAANVSGEVGVSFHGDPATGCAALAACGYSGSLAWNPNGGGTLDVVKFREGRRVRVFAVLELAGNSQSNSSLTAASVRRLATGQPAGTCADAEPSPGSLEGTVHGDKVTFTLSDGLTATRCAGPLPADLAAIGPRATVTLRALRRGHLQLDFRTRRSFASHGFAGTLTSTVVVALHRLRPSPAGGPPPPTGPPQRMRFVTESLRVTGLTGSLVATVAGSRTAEVCGLLDTCGLTGTLTLTPRVVAPQATLTATGPASRPYRDFLAALGLSRSGRARGIAVTGEVSWADPGSVSAVLRQGASCTDRAALGSGRVELQFRARTVSLAYTAGDIAGFGGPGVPRTRCPGPMLGGLTLASATLPRSSVRGHTFTLRLRGSGSVADEGYDTSLAGAITLRLRRGRVSQQVVSFPGF